MDPSVSHIPGGGEPSTPNEETRLIGESFVTMETKMQKKGNH
jgi:hypothetical protein